MKAHYRRFVDEVWNQGHLAVVAELVSSDIVHHVSGPQPGPGVEGVRQFVAEIRQAFPDLQGIIEDQIAEGDKAMDRVRCTDTHGCQFARPRPDRQTGHLPADRHQPFRRGPEGR
jgi:predicted ester cyclase